MSEQSFDMGFAARGFAAVGAPPRLEVLRVLVRAGPAGLSIGEIQRRVDIPPSTLAHHLRYLADAGLIAQRKQGRTVLNHADYSVIRGLAEFLLLECCADADACETTADAECAG